MEYEFYTDYFIVHSILQACHSRCIHGLIAVYCAPTAPLQPRILRGSSSQLTKRLPQLSRQSVQLCSCSFDDLSLAVTLLHRDLPPITLQALPPPSAGAAAALHDSVIHSLTVYCFFRLPAALAWVPSRGYGRMLGIQKFYNPIKMVTFYTQFNR